MNENKSAEELSKRFGLPPLAENVKRLTRLVSSQESDLDEVAALICPDANLTARLLRAANPEAARTEDYSVTTVAQALQRNGLGAALLLAMSDPLSCAVAKTFQTMLSTLAVLVPLKLAPLIQGDHVIGEVGFSGRATGSVYLRLAPEPAAWIAGRILGVPASEMTNPSEINDVIAELANIVVGNFKSSLCDAGLDCKLTPPQISRTSDFKLRRNTGGLAERIAFRNRDVVLFVDVCVNPWTA